MVMKEIAQGKVLYECGQKIDTLYMIMRGTVSANYPGGRHLLRNGDVVGLCEASFEGAYMKYCAEEKVTALAYPYKSGELAKLFQSSNDAVRYFQSSFFRQFNEVIGHYKLLKIESASLYDYIVGTYEDYLTLCEKYHVSSGQPAEYEELSRLSFEEDVPEWLSGYYATLEQMITVWDSNKTDNDFVCGFLLRASQDIHHIVELCNEMQEYKKDICKYLLNENGLDLVELMLNLYGKAARIGGAESDDAMSLRRSVDDIIMQLENQGYESYDFFEARKNEIAAEMEEIQSRCISPAEKKESESPEMEVLKDSLEKILTYAECEETLAKSFRKHVTQYKKIYNKNSTDDDVRLLRQEISKEFYQIYIEAFTHSVKDILIPEVVKMFFNFGYVDEELAGIENARYLYHIVDSLPTAPDRGVYSFHEWLMAIFDGRKEPGRNEFEMDFADYIHEKKRHGKITQEEESILLKNRSAKVMYELENVFPLVNKVSFGRISTFCPLFSEHNVMKPLESVLVSAEKISNIFEDIRKKDFGAYYRETLYSEPDKGVMKEFINVEVIPDIILTPNVGTRGVMWQEIEGKRRTTPARMMSSIFQMEDLSLIFIRLTGEFRWEMCKRVQGARWNDVSEASLTSEYFDYIQFYRKNQDLSADAKDKIKTDLGRAKNSFKEMFIRDYILWVLYESNGSPRLNKVARTILFSYCPFNESERTKLKVNPLYRELVEKYELRTGQKRHRMENLVQKLHGLKKGIPDEITQELRFLNF